jgi:hypothetical protein
VRWVTAPDATSRNVPARKLPEAVRMYRAGIVHRPEGHPGRPVLAWTDADRPIPQMYLAAPKEGP